MNAAALTVDAFFPSFPPAAKPTALRSLMQMWEEEAVEEQESESELMVMLSGMVGPHATAIDE
jgi:hypothetical protein